ncbi:MAG: NusG domain II-containing protein [Clostridia bacterium]|nr:NusG domain II-containing protein [Clostridia bacterium]
MFKLMKYVLPWRVGKRSPVFAVLLLILALALSGCASTPDKGGIRVLVDDEPWEGPTVSSKAGDDLRVYITSDGAPLIDLPFGTSHSVQIILPDGSENTVAITGEAVYMAHADCDNQDCVQMGAVTRENLELRVMGGFIICLPHKISVEVREG